MGTLYYDFELKDPEIKKSFENLSLAYTEKKYTSILVKSTDGDISIPLTNLGTIKAVYIKSSGSGITATINGQAIAVDDFLFVTLTALTSLTIACADATGFTVDVILWGA